MDHERLVRDFVEKELTKNKSVTGLGDNNNLIELGVIDSLGIMKLLLFLEEKFSIRLSDEDLTPQNFETLPSIVAMVERKAAHLEPR